MLNLWRVRKVQRANLHAESGFHPHAANAPISHHFQRELLTSRQNALDRCRACIQHGWVVELGGNPLLVVGFQINSSEMADWSVHYEDPTGASDKVGPVKVVSQCWIGATSERPSDLSKVANTTYTYNGSDIVVAMEVPARSGVNTQTYSCIWGFQQHVEQSLDNSYVMSSAIHNVNYFFSGIGDRDYNDPVTTLTSDTLLKMPQSELAKYLPSNIGNARNGPPASVDGNDPWAHFPWPAGRESNEEDRRHPAKFYCDKYGC